MLKKIMLGTLFTAAIGLLIFGAVTRTNAKLGYENGITASLNESYARGQGRLGQGRAGLETLNTNEPINSDQSVNTTLRGGRGGGQGQGGWQEQYPERSTMGTPQPQANAAEWFTLTGTVTSVDADQMAMQTHDGSQIIIENRAWWFATEQGFETHIGDRLSLTGFYDGDTFEAATISNQTNHQSVTIRDETGRPMWAGRGRSRSG